MLVVETIGTLAAAAQLLVYLGKAIESVYGIAKEGRYANENVKNLARELSHTQWFLSSCEKIFAGVLCQHLAEDSYTEELQAMDDEAKALVELLRKVQPEGDVKKCKWIQKSSRCKDLALHMEKSRDRLQQRLMVLQIRYSDMILRRNPEGADAFYTALDMDKGQRQLLAVEAPSDEPEHSKSSSVLAPEIQEHISPTSSTSLLPGSPRSASFIGPRQPDDSVCNKNCQCKCHRTRLRRGSTPLLSTALSPMDHRFGTVVFVKGCSSPECRASGRNKAQFTTTYPSNLFHRLVTVSLLYTGLRTSPRLETPRYVPEYADVVRATLNGDLEWLKRIFSSKLGSPNDTSIDGWSLLHTAAYYSQLEVARFLVKNGARSEVPELNNRTPFHFSMIKVLKQNATDEQKKIAELMWREVMESDCATSKEQKFIQELQLTPIHACVLRLHDANYEAPDLARLLDLAEEAKNNVQGRDWRAWKTEFEGQSPCYTDVLNHFESRAEHSQKGEATTLPTIDLIDQGDIHNWTPLHWAAYTGRFEDLKILIEHNANTLHQTSSRRNVFHHVAESGHGEMMAYLAEQPYVGSDLNVNHQDWWGETPLYIAAARTAESVKYLLKLNARASITQAEKRNPLHEAYQADEQNRLDVVTRLCDHDPTCIHAVDDGGKTPIFEYVKYTECFELLMKRGATLDQYDGKKRNLLHHACRAGSSAVLESLLTHFGSKWFGQLKLNKLINAKDALGSTPLREAFLARSASSVWQLLALNDIRVEAFIGPDGWTVLHHASRLGDLEVATYVLRSGRWELRDLLRQTVDGKTAEDIACDEGHYHGAFKELLDTVKKEQQRIVASGTNANIRSENAFYYASMK